jgi:cytochrome o ubiquinol oxidase subunit IV
MTDFSDAQGQAPGVSQNAHPGRRTYVIGLVYAVILTLASFPPASETDVINLLTESASMPICLPS